MEPFYLLNMGNISIFHLKHSELHFFALTLYKGNLKKYKGKFRKSVFWKFELLNLSKNCLMVLVCIPEVHTHLLTPILPYLDITNVECQMRHLCQKCQKCYIWRKCHPTHVIYRYGHMGVQRCARTSGMQTNAITQPMRVFNILNCQNTDFRDFPLYFSKFSLYNVSGKCYVDIGPMD